MKVKGKIIKINHLSRGRVELLIQPDKGTVVSVRTSKQTEGLAEVIKELINVGKYVVAVYLNDTFVNLIQDLQIVEFKACSSESGCIIGVQQDESLGTVYAFENEALGELELEFKFCPSCGAKLNV